MFCRKAEIADEVSEAEADNVLLGRFSCKSIFREIDIVWIIRLWAAWLLPTVHCGKT